MDNIRKTKIVCTLGPATDTDKVLRQLMIEGMNVARFNFSHGTHEEQKARFDKVAAIRTELGLPIATLLDTKGPEIRLCTMEGGKAELEAGQTFTLTARDIIGNSQCVSITYKDLYKDVHVGSKILIDDGLIEMEVVSVKDTDIVCVVQNGGPISNRKGINVPNAELSMPYVSEADYRDIVFGVKTGFDFIAASFVRTAEDILAIRKILEEQGCPTMRIIAKIENKQGVKNIDEIIKVSDGIMVARGDMGVEIPFEEVPAIQKMIIQKVYKAGKWVITATQMLDSMMKNPRPTRAEAADVANAVYDGTSAVMLSGETAAGKYPVEALRAMVKICLSTENNINYANRMKKRALEVNADITNAIAHATCTTAMELNAAAIITVSNSGRTARMVSKHRPGVPIIGCSVNPYVCRQLSLSWGVTPIMVDIKETSDELFDHAVERAEKLGMVQPGQLVVLTAGVPLGVSGTTNLIKVQVAGHVIANGRGILPIKAAGNLCVVDNAEQLQDLFKAGDIIVARDTNNEMMPELRKASGIIVEVDGRNSHAAIVGLSLDIPVIMGVKNAVERLKTGTYVTLDGQRGTVTNNMSE